MGLILAVASGIVIGLTFAFDYAFKRSAEKAKKEPIENGTFEENDAVTKHNIDVASLKNTRLARVAMFSFVAIAVIQIFNILRTKDSMSDTEKNDARLTTIEHYLWGNEGGPGPDTPPLDPKGLDGFLRKLDAKIEEVRKNLDVMSNRQARLSTKMVADIQKLQTEMPHPKKLAPRRRGQYPKIRRSPKKTQHAAMSR